MQRLSDSPCGETVPIGGGQSAFIPNPLPRELAMSSRLVLLLDNASRAVATLAGVGETVPNPHVLAQPFIRREAVLSSRIEGTLASLSDVLAYEASGRKRSGGDVEEVGNYVVALEYGIERLESLPISFRLVNELHERLMSGVRGEDKMPGHFRTTQVWIGAPGSSIRDARFVPPPPERLRDLFFEWESFVNESHNLPPLVRCALMHYQIETIHPYLDGNGRIGRLLITLFLIDSGVLRTPLLYLSAYFERDRAEVLRRVAQCERDWRLGEMADLFSWGGVSGVAGCTRKNPSREKPPGRVARNSSKPQGIEQRPAVAGRPVRSSDNDCLAGFAAARSQRSGGASGSGSPDRRGDCQSNRKFPSEFVCGAEAHRGDRASD